MSDPSVDLSSIALTHGRALWALRHLFAEGRHLDTDSAHNAYVKFLRRAGLPFETEELGMGPGGNVIYHYEHLMELAVALQLRNMAILPRDVVNLLISTRGELRPMYRRAYKERRSGLGKPITVSFSDSKESLTAMGLFLDLHLRYAAPKMLTIATPKLLGPRQAAYEFYRRGRAIPFRSLIPISDIAEEVVRAASVAPEIKRGRPG